MSNHSGWYRQLGTVGAFVILAVLSGVIGGRSDAAFTRAKPWRIVTEPVSINVGWFVAVLIFSAIALWLWQVILEGREKTEIARERAALQDDQEDVAAGERARTLVELDDTLFRSIHILIQNEQQKEACQRLLREFLRDATAFLGDEVNRASIYLPVDGYLRIWAHFEMSEESITRDCFAIVDGGKGIALQVFQKGKLHVERKKPRGKGAKSSWSRAYVDFEPARKKQLYSSFICCPILSGSRDRAPIGVVCFDSPNVSAFDDRTTQELVTSLAARIAVALQVAQIGG